MLFAAKLGGKVVTYPKAATFVIQQKAHGRKQPTVLVASRETLDLALKKFHRCETEGATTTLCPVVEGRFLKPILKG